ncbi:MULTISPECIES: hypothetical protein [Rhizobium]|uniref:Uncharacterized protein n=1 Tax=Rhizobium wenxiniae TaxID=1737357 RepID=A0A7W9Y9W2_9HYPH|nr:hypothetical protein [Rhizobium wenxiniae]MBB6164717.1 hypothetical protein [Rhizobium wenxiniae]GGG06291.1 hypothetical protein GCM10010924_38690 [Rhizobium wenxiniae]
MKTPWRFLSDLVSRKSEDRPVEQITKASAVVAIEHYPEEEVPPSSAVSVENPVEAETNLAAQEVEATEIALAVPVVEGDAIEQSLEPVEMDFSAEPEALPKEQASEFDDAGDVAEDAALATAPKATATKRRGRAAPAASPIGLPREQEPDQSSVKKTAYDEMIELDQEILELRQLLSKKLIIQNAQLKTLLDRY